jgi:hypothetical protein
MFGQRYASLKCLLGNVAPLSFDVGEEFLTKFSREFGYDFKTRSVIKYKIQVGFRW